VKRLLVTGGTGMLGSTFKEVLGYEAILVGSKECDLRDPVMTDKLICVMKPDYIVHLAARVGGVKGNTDFVGEFFSDNILINTNVLSAAHKSNTKKVVSLLSTCVYPEEVRYPLTENQIHNGEPHPSNFGYAYAKRMLDVQSRAYRQQYGCNFITAVPNNLYGESDNFHLEHGHVLPTIIRKVYEAKISDGEVRLWGDGSPLREFTYSEDIRDILLFLLENYDATDPINIGTTDEISIKDLCVIVCDILNYKGKVLWNTDMPAGQFKKPSSNKKLIDLGGVGEYTSIHEGVKKTCDWFVENYPNVRGVNND
jgi:GDP-L-fucose synthase